ncbi:MAG TPA: HEAT repeat domain-containing protein [Chryseosolibacter sp.]|nr:HEAT repeat domain-containing protein [Chryseosolibacter sp.]
MEKEILESLIIDYIDNKLTTADRQRVEHELVNNPAAYRLYEELKEILHVMDHASRLEPSTKLKAGFESILNEEVKSSGRGKTVSFYGNFYRIAAAVALLVVGGSIGFWISKYNEQQAHMIAIQNDLANTRRLMLAMLNDDQSASKRIQGVNQTIGLETVDAQLVNALVNRLNQDPNSNVRLAALEALSRFLDEPNVKAKLIKSLETQNDPVVQIALIQLMVQIKEKSVIKELERIVDDAESLDAVKDEAHTGILKLS